MNKREQWVKIFRTHELGWNTLNEAENLQVGISEILESEQKEGWCIISVQVAPCWTPEGMVYVVTVLVEDAAEYE